MSLKLTLNHIGVPPASTVPVLVNADGTATTFSVTDRLPFTNGTAGDYIMRCLLGDEPLASDLPLEVDKDADFATYCWRYLDEKTSDETRRYAEFYHKLKTRGIKIPERTTG